METIDRICHEEAEKSPDDIESAIESALKRAKRLKDFADFQDALIREAFREKVYDARHAMNVEMRRANNGYGGEAKVTAGGAVQKVAQSLYAYMIAGRTLGTVLGEELEDIAANEESKANGHMFNAKLARELQAIVPEGKAVRECVKEQKLKKLFEELLK